VCICKLQASYSQPDCGFFLTDMFIVRDVLLQILKAGRPIFSPQLKLCEIWNIYTAFSSQIRSKDVSFASEFFLLHMANCSSTFCLAFNLWTVPLMLVIFSCKNVTVRRTRQDGILNHN
jgi:hypothetical protein